jgi:tRNA(Ile)-lysidine synthase
MEDRLNPLVNDLLQVCTTGDSDGSLVVHLTPLLQQPEFLQSEIFYRVLKTFGIDPSEEKVERFERLIQSPIGTTEEIGSGIHALKDRNSIMVYPAPELSLSHAVIQPGSELQTPFGTIAVSTPMPVPATYSADRNIEYIDAARLHGTFTLRSWEEGDWFVPLGCNGRKKISDFFSDEKVPRYRKSTIPILESDGAIVWICGKRLDDRFKLTTDSHAAIQLTYHPLHQP